MFLRTAFKVFIFTTIQFVGLFLFLYPDYGHSMVKVETLWTYDLDSDQKISSYLKRDALYFPRVFSLLGDDVIRSFYYQNQQILVNKTYYREQDKRSLIYLPLFTDSWYRYTKNKSKIIYESGKNESIYWEKNYSGYPVSDSLGKFFMILAGDHSTFHLYDNNSRLLYEFAGIYLTDICQNEGYPIESQAPIQTVLFSEGVFVTIQDGIAQNYNLEDIFPNAYFFMKSCALSNNGHKLVIHSLVQSYSKEDSTTTDSDMFFLFEKQEDGQMQLQEHIRSEQIYPHLLSMVINDWGIIYGNKNDIAYIAFDDEDKKRYWRKSGLDDKNINYRPLVALRESFIYNEGQSMILLDQSGKKIFGLELTRTPLRFISLPVAVEFDNKEDDDKQCEKVLIEYADVIQILCIY